VTCAKAERRGRVAEWAAMLFLMAKGYRILGRRLRMPSGEVDVAAWKSGVLVIVEVKARNTYDAGAYAVTPTAQERIARRKGAGRTLATHGCADPL
jgi:putative endonuclease